MLRSSRISAKFVAVVCAFALTAPTAAAERPIQLLRDIEPGRRDSLPGPFTVLGDAVLFPVGDYDGALWTSDGTEAGTRPVSRRPRVRAEWEGWPAFDRTGWPVLGGAAYLAADDGTHGDELWTTDGTKAGTAMVRDIRPGRRGSYPRLFTPAGGFMYFVADDGIHGEELWRSDGTEAGTVLVRDIAPPLDEQGQRPSVDAVVAVGDRVFLAAHDAAHGYELWVSDGTTQGTALVTDLWPGPDSSYPGFFTAVGGTLFFVAAVGERHGDAISYSEYLWTTDGTRAGTEQVAPFSFGHDFDEYLGHGFPSFAAVGDTLYFGTEDGSHGIELWKSDGTRAGTVLIKDIAPGIADGVPGWITPVGDAITFTANDRRHGWEVWTSDGTEAGTRMVRDIAPGRAGSGGIPFFTMVGPTVYFAANDHVHGMELWRSDGTRGGTTMVADLLHGPKGSHPWWIARFLDGLVFSASTPSTGREPWILKR